MSKTATFHQLIVHPAQFIKTSTQHPALWLSITAIAASAATVLTEKNPYHFPAIPLYGFILISYIIILFLHSIMTDFFAQLFSLKANSYALFRWFGISTLPIALNVPINTIAHTFPQFFFGILHMASPILTLLCMYLQVLSIQSLYHCSLKKGIFLFLCPFLAVIALILAGFSLLTGIKLFTALPMI